MRDKFKVAKNYKDLKVFNLAYESAMQIYNITKKWPAGEKYALTSQILRSSRSVCSNIAEAWRKRKYPKHFISKLSDADAEAAETEVWIEFAFDCEYLDKSLFLEFKDNYDHICRMLAKIMTNSESWCNNLISENYTMDEYTIRVTPYAERATSRE